MRLPTAKKSTRETVREPTMLTLALTGIVPWTLDPWPGDVRVTIRLPPGGGSNCAMAGATAPIVRTSAARRATSLFNQRLCAKIGFQHRQIYAGGQPRERTPRG